MVWSIVIIFLLCCDIRNKGLEYKIEMNYELYYDNNYLSEIYTQNIAANKIRHY